MQKNDTQKDAILFHLMYPGVIGFWRIPFYFDCFNH